MKLDPNSEPVPFQKVAAAESQQIAARRAKTIGPARHGYVGVGLSGGGIRSGTLNLGILQALSRRGLLPYVDYLSTVSGGGYIGTWLHAVIARYGNGEPARVEPLLMPQPARVPGPPDEDPISFLRKYSSYLAPEMGLFSADFWVILVIWFRNMFLNQLILIPFLAGILLVAMHAGFAADLLANSGWSYGLIAIAGLCMAIAVVIGAIGVKATIDTQKHERGLGAKGAAAGVGFLVIASFLLTCASPMFKSGFALWPFLVGTFGTIVLFGFLQGMGGFVKCYAERHEGNSAGGVLWLAICSIVSGAVTASLLYGSLVWMGAWPASATVSWHCIAFGPPLLMLAFIAGAGLHIGLMGADFPDFSREWLARTGAFLVIAAFVWMALFVFAVFGPFWIAGFALHWGKTVASFVAAWIAASAAGVFSGKSEKTNGSPDDSRTSRSLKLIVTCAPTIFLIGFLLLISFGLHFALGAIPGLPCRVAQATTPPVEQQNITVQVSGPEAGRPAVHIDIDKDKNGVPDWLQWLAPIERDYWCPLGHTARRRWAFVFLLAAVILVGLLPFRFNINEFSMHHFYKNRLVRCYLGASRGRSRRPSKLTGFDPSDDFPLLTLLSMPELANQPCDKIIERPYYGPYPIINGTINLDRGSELAKRERKGESFVFTPLYCGYDPPRSPEDEKSYNAKLRPDGYRSTCGYGYPSGPAIGTCTAISGAAANPNSGYSTSPTMAFLLTIFDVRLGWWLGNPRRRDVSNNPGPRYALWPLISELFAQTDQRAAYLNISDGGHFENLGLYELVRRRCRYVIIGDGEQDQNLSFESLGGAVRKCRADFGVEIDIDPRRIERKERFSRTHCVVGRIHYPDCEPGWLLYLKSSLTGDEPEDVSQYHAAHPDFPHQPTPNQFFTESQFESYRRLGQHIVDSTFCNTSFTSTDPDAIEKLFQCLYNQWYPPSEVAEGVSTRHTEVYSNLIKRLSQEDDLAYLESQIFCGADNPDCGRDPHPGHATTPEAERKARFYCLELIQLMENVWADLHFFNKADRENPKNSGWIGVFQHWARQPDIQAAWELYGHTFNGLFQQFFNSMATARAQRQQPPPCGELPK